MYVFFMFYRKIILIYYVYDNIFDYIKILVFVINDNRKYYIKNEMK